MSQISSKQPVAPRWPLAITSTVHGLRGAETLGIMVAITCHGLKLVVLDEASIS
jgi:hypothetical protein